ncbi:hypothetical protein ACTMSW_25980 [Micromonospora sp. BQ11]|uniref:hypothetical protein n=1 Tax=Micromonospora sp. BQ11 TaxID=3452212 RepID=UPI003F89EE5A
MLPLRTTLTRRQALTALVGAGVLLSTTAAGPGSPARPGNPPQTDPGTPGASTRSTPDTGYAHLLGVL